MTKHIDHLCLPERFESVKFSKPVNNIDSIAKMVAWFVGFLVFIFLLAAIVVV